ncbi:Phosphatidylglycerophosphatase A [Pigmentiphaga humi]|uniref:Phosphatidylglycerophosphatase A n=1 Tax=Pigmentiphaga humi TaxID=2478468 RepID=A0A3P4B0Z4_9BURK|nr:Phosphatidylglycerophosphatase A [Pigmentiphaga humi]
MTDASSSAALPAAPSFGWMRARLSRTIAFGLGSGLIRPAPGTWGTLLAWVLWQPLTLLLATPAYQALFLLAAFALGIWACDRAGRDLGMPDHGGMVWDEMVAFWTVLWLIPGSAVAQAFGFLLFRLFDILKPPPIGHFDRKLKNGLGVMWDDMIAAFYTLLVFALYLRIAG